ncbi:DUF6264 family protein [Curtobacterium sp. AG1037]|uniref:DUF6264 family protein n=1 Tax=Curtobacterium sp. AG1037 TaxID=2183990 RepID=UPI0011C055F8
MRGASTGGVGLEARPPSSGPRRAADVVASVVLLVLLAVESVVAAMGILLLSLGFSSCRAPGNTCDQGLGGAVVYVGPVLVALVFVAALVVSIVRLVKRRLTWPVPLLGAGLVVVVFFVARALADVAVTRGI